MCFTAKLYFSCLVSLKEQELCCFAMYVSACVDLHCLTPCASHLYHLNKISVHIKHLKCTMALRSKNFFFFSYKDFAFEFFIKISIKIYL